MSRPRSKNNSALFFCLATIVALVDVSLTSAQTQPSGSATSEQSQRAAAQTKIAAARFAENHDIAAAKVAFTKARDIDPSYPPPWYYLGRLAEMQENWNEAIADYEQLAKLDQTSDFYVKSQLRLDKDRKLAEEDKTPEGKQHRQFAEAMSIAKAALKAGKPADAIAAAHHAAQVDPTNWEAPALEGTIFAQLRQWKLADDALNKALSLAPAEKQSALQAAIAQCENGSATPSLIIDAQSAAKAGDYDNAAQKFRLALILMPSREDWGLSAATAFVAAGNNSQAAALLNPLVSSQNASIAKAASNKLAALQPLLQSANTTARPPDAVDDASKNLILNAACGHAGAEYGLGVLYRDGKLFGQDDVEAMIWFRKAAEQGSVDAMNEVACLYQHGRGVAQDYTQAMQWYQTAASRGNANAMYWCGNFYANGRMVQQDYEEAAQWFLKAASEGNRDAMDFLGALYATGVGVKRNDVQALRWFQRAAAEGNIDAMCWMGVFCERGRAVSHDFQVAQDWYKKAAAGGSLYAQMRLKDYTN